MYWSKCVESLYHLFSFLDSAIINDLIDTKINTTYKFDYIRFFCSFHSLSLSHSSKYTMKHIDYFSSALVYFEFEWVNVRVKWTWLLLLLYNCGIFLEHKKHKNNSVCRCEKPLNGIGHKQENWVMFGISLEANGLTTRTKSINNINLLSNSVKNSELGNNNHVYALTHTATIYV